MKLNEAAQNILNTDKAAKKAELKEAPMPPAMNVDGRLMQKLVKTGKIAITVAPEGDLQDVTDMVYLPDDYDKDEGESPWFLYATGHRYSINDASIKIFYLHPVTLTFN